jgi:hypothetical protein
MLPTLHVHLLGDFRLVYGELPVTSIDSLRHRDQFHHTTAPDMSDWYLRHRDQFPSPEGAQ